MPERTVSVADRVRAARRLRGMTQEELAEKAEISLGGVKKIEQGKFSPRVPTLARIARALDVTTSSLMSDQPPTPVEERPEDLVLAQLRAAVCPPRGLTGEPILGSTDERPDLARLARSVSAVEGAYLADRYDALSGMIPPLLRSAHHHVAVFGDGDEHRRALRIRADILGVSGRYLIQVRAHDLALCALQDSLADALTLGDMSRAAAAISGQAHAMLRQGRFDEVEALCASTADELEPVLSKATPDELAAWGWMLMRASAAAARNNRPEEARDYLKSAEAAAARLDGEMGTVDGKTFGQTTVRLKKPENALIGGKPERALDLSAELRPTGIRPEEWDRHRLDVAHAYALTGLPARATEVLTEIRRTRPGWLRYQQQGRDVVARILNSRPRMPSRDQRALAEFMGVQG